MIAGSSEHRVGGPRLVRRIPTVAVLPTLFTLGNLVCGFFAIVVASRVDIRDPLAADPTDWTNCMLSGWLILLAMVFDALDGHVARLSGTSSAFGEQLDSLCDAVSFGVAPAFLLVKICPDFAAVHRGMIWVIAASFAVCAVLRLARFTVETGEEDDHMNFRGLPTPAAAFSIASFAIMFYALDKQETPAAFASQLYSLLQMTLPFYALLVALLMVSWVPYPHVVNQSLRGQKSFSFIVRIVFGLVAVMMFRSYALPLVSTVFVLGPPIKWVIQEVSRERKPPELI